MPKQIVCKICGSYRHYQTFCPSKRKMPGKKPCKYCGNPDHTSIVCFKKPRGKLKSESKSTKNKREKFRELLFMVYPPDEKGNWYCYLNISPYCFKVLDENTLVWEHVKPRASHPELKYETSNIKPSCEPCNVLKSGKSLEKLSGAFPQLKKYLS